MIPRRTFLGGAAAGIASALAPRFARATQERMPVVYVSHGVPLYMPGNEARRAALRAWAEHLPRPRAILVMTPHFASRALTLGMTREGFAWYDLPARFSRMLPQDLEYRTPPSAALAARVAALLAAPVEHAEQRRGFDHTTWMPLKAMFPAADVPVLEIAYPYVPEAEAFALGQKLAPLREEGVLFVASGGMTHNLAIGVDGPVPPFATEFDAWAAEALARREIDALVDWRHRAPASLLAHPDDGAHFRVLLAALGVASGGAGATFPITGFEAALSLRCVELG
jgi:4,5-DOPA dioxygenase extradiol